ncbi:protein NYNRIN-like [Microplitis mediator]|uniref:protein NYNRIN-like n=1 Tax=Microplitis mediator TaxID=375433 RepID=UPI002557A6CF|nr:protein NYNRIN-like [Microplitis mediator]
MIAADVMCAGTPTKSGHTAILVIQDLYTKWVELYPLKRATGAKIVCALEDLIMCRWGVPKVLLTDNGTEFVNRDLHALAARIGYKHVTTPPYHAQANPVERVNRVLGTMIRAFIGADHREWDLPLHEFRFAYNTAFHSSVGATPAFANFGREPEAAISLRREVEGVIEIIPRPHQEWVDRMARLNKWRESIVHALETAFQRQAHYYNLRRRHRQYQVGDLVLKRQHVLSSAAKRFTAKMMTPFHGPFIVSRRISDTVYELESLDGRNLGKISVQDLKPYHTPE